MREPLSPPYFLVALPQMDDELFSKTVVLLTNHDPKGAYGIILNKPLLDEEESASAQMKAEIKDPDGNVILQFSEDLYQGGPVHNESVFVLHDVAAVAVSESKIANEELFLTSDPQAFGPVLESTKQGSHHKRFFLGTCAWLPGQLEAEMKSGAWILIPLKKEFLFDSIPHEVGGAIDVVDCKKWQEEFWKKVLRSGGLDPLTLRSQGSADSGPN